MSTTKYIIDNQNSSLSGQSIIGNLSATTFYGDGSNLTGINIINDAVDILYSNLYNLIISSGLTAGTTYRLTDYKSVNYVNGWNAMNSQQSSSVAYAGLIDGSFQAGDGFYSYVTTMDFQRSGSYYFDGSTNSQILIVNAGEFVIGTNDFTIEWYQYLQNGSSCCPRPFSIGTYGGDVKIAVSFEGDTYFWWNNSAKIVNLNTTLIDTWSHFAITRQSGTVKIFQDGNQVFEEVLNDDLQSVYDLSIGNETSPNTSGTFRGFITNFRYISGTSIYNSNFTPSVKPLYVTSDTVLLLSVKDNNNLTENNVYGQNLNISNYSVTFNPTAPFSDYDVFVGGDFVVYNNIYPWVRLIKLKSDGSVDQSFYTGGKDYGFDGEISVIKILNDGKVLVGGFFYNYSGTSNNFLVKLNTDGTLDPNFSTTINPNYIDGYVRDIFIEDKTGNIFIGGSFTTIGGDTYERLAKLDPNGFLISTFNSSFNDDVLTIEMINNILCVGGNFSNVNGSSSNFIVQVNPDDGTTVNNAVGIGFNNLIRKIKKTSVNTLVCVGIFTQYDGTDSYRIITLANDLSLDNTFYGSSNFNDECYSLDLDCLNNIYVGGQFSNYNGNSVSRIAKLDIGGNLDLNFNCEADNQVYYLSITMKNRLFIGGNFNLINQSTNNNYIIRVMSDDLSSVYNSTDTYTSDEEVLYVKAISNNQIDKISYSEKYPNDIIEYSPYTNVIGKNQEYYNGTTLYDGTYLSTFDLLWDDVTKQVYFEMPENNPIYFGHYMYFYAEFYNGDSSYYSSFTAEPVEPGFRVPQYNNTDGDYNFKSTNLIVSSGGTKVILTDFSYDDYLNYYSSSLYVETISKTIDCYGYITKRIDTDRNIDVPFDFRNIKYRRYEMNLNSINSTFGTDFYGFYDRINTYFGGPSNLVDTTGKYKDFYSFDSIVGSYEIAPRNIYFYGAGSPDGGSWYAGVYDNNIFIGNVYNNKISSSYFVNNTFMYSFYENELQGYFEGNIFNEEFYSNQIIGQASCYSNILGYGFNGNVISNCLFVNNNINYGFANNQINGFFGYNTISQYFINNKINTQFQSNTIYSYFQNNDINYSFYENITNSNFQNNIILASFHHTTLNYFQFNIINADMSYVTTNNPVSYLTVNAELFNKSFNSATYIYGDYSKEIVKSTDSGTYIGFLSGASKTYITPVTS